MADSSSTPAKEPSAGDIAFMVLVFKHMKEKPALDWNVLATAGGFKNQNVAMTRYSQIRKKLGTTEAAAPKTPTKKKAGDSPASASKVTKSGGRVGTKGKKGKAVIKAEEAEDDEEPIVKPEVDDREATIKPESDN
ncbi:hypothetical protein CkaCkLH20_04871 [Colletotrichum karsti]|uniref:Uncharacterized protein n=1 Tax=Colletotrichum karsti TaxID=1095194 RepID=A0A9P6I9N7_9PEZI|nr:uncharacterized protein CkaCkLH20_04871 [Colletotrichum karsti]KAF9877736.1 hypothetical protein CkaCkLH20_04871 [Colletotrichum karsti]